jgi:hypothetical protein
VLAVAGCARLFPRPTPPAPPPEPAAPQGTLPPSDTGPPPPSGPLPPDKPGVPRGVVTDAEKPEWMRGLVMPDLPLRWYPKVTRFLELYKNDPRYREIMKGWLRRLPVYRAKKDFIDKNGLVVFRLHDNWLARKDSEMTAGLAEALGWGQYRIRANDAHYEVPPASAEQTVALIREKLKLRDGLRAVGDRMEELVADKGYHSQQVLAQLSQ